MFAGLSLRICSRLTKDIADLNEATLVEVDHHKEESTSIIKADSDERNPIRDKLETCVDPLDVLSTSYQHCHQEDQQHKYQC